MTIDETNLHLRENFYKNTFISTSMNSKSIDASLLCMDFKYILNVLNSVEQNYYAAIHSPRYASVLYMSNSKLMHSIDGWTIYAELSATDDELFIHRTLPSKQISIFESISSYVISEYESSQYDPVLRKRVYTISNDNIQELYFFDITTEDEVINEIESRLMIIDDYIASGQEPERCTTIACDDSCQFSKHCSLSTYDAVPW